MSAQVLTGDCRKLMAAMEPASVDAIVCDPPYGLAFMGRAWDRHDSARAYEAWCSTWAEQALRVLRPGGYLLAFGGTRTYHRLVCGIEDAGFYAADCLVWLYGQGFPKFRSALKPAWEPVTVCRSPGSGGLNIEGSRIPALDGGSRVSAVRSADGTNKVYRSGRSPAGPVEYETPEAGRWPPNVALDDAVAASLGEVSRFFYVAKASRIERNAGLEAFEERPKAETYGDGFNSATKLDPARGHTPESVAARPLTRNPHPTVKPVDLMRWLVRLVTPPGGLVLDPFAGSGTTGIAAVLEGLRFVGHEEEPAFADIARARIAHFERHGEAALEVVRSAERGERERAGHAARGQLDLFGGVA